MRTVGRRAFRTVQLFYTILFCVGRKGRTLRCQAIRQRIRGHVGGPAGAGKDAQEEQQGHREW